MAKDAIYDIQKLSRTESASDEQIIRVQHRPTGACLELHPTVGALCTRWQVPTQQGLQDLLWFDPKYPKNVHPTKQGIPILFPFPNRIAEGRFYWQRKQYQLPCNDPSGCHAIHGFVADKKWELVDMKANDDQAVLKLSTVVDEAAAWPAQATLKTTFIWKLFSLTMLFEVQVDASKEFPFGLGVHPYWAWPADQVTLHLSDYSKIPEQWELIDCIPTGKRLALNESVLAQMQDGECTIGKEHWDHAFRCNHPSLDWGLSAPGYGVLCTHCSASFQDFVVFTPVHRQAICIEPYTCMTDAINHLEQMDDTGWMVLAPGQTWRGKITWTWAAGHEDHLASSRV